MKRHIGWRWAGFMILLGLLIEAASLLWIGPGAFLTYMFGSGLLITLGVLIFLAALLGLRPEPPEG